MWGHRWVRSYCMSRPGLRLCVRGWLLHVCWPAFVHAGMWPRGAGVHTPYRWVGACVYMSCAAIRKYTWGHMLLVGHGWRHRRDAYGQARCSKGVQMGDGTQREMGD